MQYAIIWYITLTMKSGTWAAVSVICNLLPMFLMMPVVGVWADRYHRKMLLMVSDGFMALVALLLIFVYPSNGSIGWLLIALFLRAFGAAVQTPCINAMIPDIVPKAKLTRVNGIYHAVSSIVQIIAPLIAASLIAFVPLVYVFLLDVAAAVIAISLLLFGLQIHEDANKTNSTNNTYMHDIKQGFLYVWKTPFLRSFFVFMTVSFFLTAPAFYLTPVHIALQFGDDVWYLSLAEMALTIGLLVGSAMVAARGKFQSKHRSIAFGTLCMALLTSIMGFSGSVYMFWAAIGWFGLANAITGAAETVFLQENADKAYLGRIFSFFMLLNTGFLQLGMAVFGPLGDWIGTQSVFIGCGVLLAIGSLFFIKNGAMRALEAK